MRPTGRVEYGNNRVQEIVSGTDGLSTRVMRLIHRMHETRLDPEFVSLNRRTVQDLTANISRLLTFNLYGSILTWYRTAYGFDHFSQSVLLASSETDPLSGVGSPPVPSVLGGPCS